MNWLRRLFCGHTQTDFVRNIHGDEIIVCGYKRSVWRCHKCGSFILQDALVYDTRPPELAAEAPAP